MLGSLICDIILTIFQTRFKNAYSEANKMKIFNFSQDTGQDLRVNMRILH